MKKFKRVLPIVALSVLFFACKKEEIQEPIEEPAVVSSPTDDLLKIGDTYVVGAKTKATVYATSKLQTGYNTLYIQFSDSADGSIITSGQLTATAMMDMGSMKHSTPIENSDVTAPSDGLFKVGVVFIMPGKNTEWSLDLNFKNNKTNLTGLGKIGVEVLDATPSKMKSTVLPLDGNKKVFISLLEPETGKVGINDFQITIHEKLSMMSFPPAEGYSVKIVPEMPSMGHGSPNNVDPVHTGKGHYAGKVNYTMTGLWYIHIHLYKNDSLISSDQYFEMTLK